MPVEVDEGGPYDLTIRRNRSGSFTATYQDSAGTAIDLTGYSALAAVYDKPLDQSGALLATLTAAVTTPASGLITVSWEPSATSGISTATTEGWWELVVYSGSTSRVTLLEGRVTISPRHAVT